jgi:hypothetical protein
VVEIKWNGWDGFCIIFHTCGEKVQRVTVKTRNVLIHKSLASSENL